MEPKPSERGGLVAIGRVRRPHGVRGELCVEPYAADMHRYDSLQRVFIREREHRVRSVRPHGDVVLLFLEGVDGREAAEAMRNVEVAVPATERAPLPPDRFYIDDLVGLRVVDTEGRLRGSVVEVMERPGAHLLRLTTPAGEEGFVPLVRAIVKGVDVAAGEVVIDPPEGLLPPVGTPEGD